MKNVTENKYDKKYDNLQNKWEYFVKPEIEKIRNKTQDSTLVKINLDEIISPGCITETLDKIENLIEVIDDLKYEAEWVETENGLELEPKTYGTTITIDLSSFHDMFKLLLSNVAQEIKKYCENKECESLQKLFTECKWVSGVVAYDKKTLDFIAQNEYIKVLEVFAEYDSKFKEYALNILTSATENKQDECVKFLIEREISPESLLGTECYYGTNEEIVKSFTEHLTKNDENYEQELSQKAKHYEGMFFYGKEMYEKAIECFAKVTHENIAAPALFYKGLCHEYAKKLEDAKLIFKHIRNTEFNYYDIKSIKQYVKEHLNKLQQTDFDNDKVKAVNAWAETIIQNFKQHTLLKECKSEIEVLKKNNTKLEQHIKDPSKVLEIHEDLRLVLSEIKHISLKKKAGDKIVIFHEFGDFSEVKNSSEYNNIDEKKLTDYKSAIDIVDNNIKTLGELCNDIEFVEIN